MDAVACALVLFLAAAFFILLARPCRDRPGWKAANHLRPVEEKESPKEERMICEMAMLANAIFMCQRTFGAGGCPKGLSSLVWGRISATVGAAWAGPGGPWRDMA